ncbi:putative hydrolase KNAG_0J02630 [Huiozyma naganishii CBS 8797]|uniref:CN hydrolase domain-containing protein n=1 Tax=Huiozyma naganishii (strain ATCC MYA-139 / BCRC 22969 / CBS 8797 / KCTC 17520 / NBRC 10181 / NCYC 3082 / Yp74L-3) TaxID=1071383 RepID=J7S303_HUIN7|nr:hypothetical protein KNAG_0J02630 [Kazachstania naganishii CBS 8797]CCK72342.1 hypothetical protein KNAG_0J02630 [Kazachstania naganishii CBS 8797]
MNRIAIGQLCSSSNMWENLAVIKRLISRALKQDVKVIFFPEATDYLGQNAEHSSVLSRETPKFVSKLQESIRSLTHETGKKIDVSIGVHLPPTRSVDAVQDSRVKNVLLYIDSDGQIVQKYQKLHLFDVDVPRGPILKESLSVQPGDRIPPIIDTPVGCLGSAICYDIRFSELSLKLRSMGAELLCFPSAFTMKTGDAHWEILARARAIDTQCFVVMPAQCGKHELRVDDWSRDHASLNTPERESWGHSLIVDPWGDVIAQADIDGPNEQLIVADIDIAKLQEVRERMPLWEQRRRDLFPSV